MNALIGTILALGVGAGWLGALGLYRLPGALDRLHAATLVLTVGGASWTLGVLVQGGSSARVAKVLLVWLLMLAAGAASTPALARAFYRRGAEQ